MSSLVSLVGGSVPFKVVCTRRSHKAQSIKNIAFNRNKLLYSTHIILHNAAAQYQYQIQTQPETNRVLDGTMSNAPTITPLDQQPIELQTETPEEAEPTDRARKTHGIIPKPIAPIEEATR